MNYSNIFVPIIRTISTESHPEENGSEDYENNQILNSIDTDVSQIICYQSESQNFHIFYFRETTDIPDDNKSLIESKFTNKSFMSFGLHDSFQEFNFKTLFHPFFLARYENSISEVMLKDEKIIETTIGYHKNVEPLYILGTNFGRVLIFKIFFIKSKPEFFYYSINFDESEINVLFVRKELLFISSLNGKLGVYTISTPELSKLVSVKSNSIHKDILNIDFSSLLVYQKMLVSPLKRFLRVKIIESAYGQQAQEENYFQYYTHAKQQIALILKNNSLAIFSRESNTIEFECKMNETSVLGVFIDPLLDYLMILNSNGNISIYSINTGRYERTVVIKDYKSLLDIPKSISIFSSHYQEYNTYPLETEHIGKYGSRVHGVLEFNTRSYRNFLFGMDKEKAKNEESKHKLLCERLGNMDKINYINRDNPQITWLLHYSNDFLYSSKCRKNGIAFLNLYLDSPIKEVKYCGSTAHILIFDAKTCLQTKSNNQEEMNQDEIRVVNKKTRTLENSKFTFLPFLFPWGLEKKMDEEILELCGDKLPVFSYYSGVQGIGETFAFILDEKVDEANKILEENGFEELKMLFPLRNWRTSNYLTTIQALGFMLYYILCSQEDDKKTVNLIGETLHLINQILPKQFSDYKPIKISLLSQFCILEDMDIISAACNLMVSCLAQCPNLVTNDSIVRTYQYMKTSIKFAEDNHSQGIPMECYEAILLSNLAYWAVFHDPKNDRDTNLLQKEISYFSFQNLMKALDITYCIHNPYVVVASMKILIDGATHFKGYLFKLEDLFFYIIMINFHYTASLDENIRSTRDITNIANPIATKFKNVMDELLKQPIELRKLLKNFSLKLLLIMGELFAKEFSTFIVKEAKNIALNVHYPSVVIDIIRNYIKKYRMRALGELPKLIEAILYCLDPNNPIVRKTSHKAASHTLQTIFKIYSMVSFHQQTQRFAVGSLDNTIILYDLRTAVKLKILEGHRAPSTSLSFSTSGKYLASFSEKESTLRVWKVGGATGFLTSVFGFSGKHFKTFEIPPESYKTENIDHNFKLDFSQDERNLVLTIDDKSYTFDIQE